MKSMKPLTLVAISLSVALVPDLGGTYAGENIIDLRAVQGSGVQVLENYSGEPDKHGTFESYCLELPEFERAVYYRSGWWPAGGNRVFPEVHEDFSELAEGGIFILFELEDNSYLAVLPISGPIAYSWLGADKEKLQLKMGTHGNEPIKGTIPLCSWAKSSNPYEACNTAWKKALNCKQIKGAARMREQKKYPEPFKYLGWCSWEHYKGRINEQNMVRAMKDIENSEIPIRFFLVDDGHFDRQSLAPNDKFPNGYKPLTDMRKADKIRWVGIWYAFLGNNHGVQAPGDLGKITGFTYECRAKKLLPLCNEQAAETFYGYMLACAKRDDVDFLKVDFQTDALPFYAGVPHSNPLKGLPADNTSAAGNPVAAATNLARVFQSVVEERMNGLINCNWHNAVSLFNSGSSVVGRCSEDYKVGNLQKAKSHLHHSYAATPWLGQTAWGDHDMFHSNDTFAGRIMAVSKAMSGGPVYLSDEPTGFDAEAIYPLVYQDGYLLRPVAPAAPLHEDLFYEPDEGRLYRVVAPLANRTAAIVVYNLDGGAEDNEKVISTVITPRDYARASGMIQPYPGQWNIPAEGLLVYDWYAGKARKLAGEYEVAIRGFGDRLLQLSPIENGWSVVGRTDKYLSAAAVQVLSVKVNELKIRMAESGPLVVWTEHGTPEAPGINLADAGEGLYKADMPIGQKQKVITITRADYRDN